jgi:hypothetical protein
MQSGFDKKWIDPGKYPVSFCQATLTLSFLHFQKAEPDVR